MDFDWSELAFASKQPMNDLQATFIAAPRELSPERFKQLLKTYLVSGPIVLGLAKEKYVLGFEEQPQFKLLERSHVQKIIEQVNKSASTNKIYILSYFQRELKYLLEKLDFKKVVLVNGSWKHTFHTSESYYVLATRQTPYSMVSPFADELEAQTYEQRMSKQLEEAHPFRPNTYTDNQMLEKAQEIARYSYDYSFQTGVALGKKQGKKYSLLAWAYNKVVPYQTYALHHGALREKHFSPPHDLNYYDTIHAEIALLIKAQKEKIDLAGTTVFINLLPCPACARMFSETDIAEFVYKEDHSAGYAVDLLTKAGKQVRRVV